MNKHDLQAHEQYMQHQYQADHADKQLSPAATRETLFGQMFDQLLNADYARAFRIVSRLLALAGFALLSYTLYRYVQVDGVGALGSAGHYGMGAFFTLMTFATGKQYDGWNFLFLLGLLGIIATF